LRSSIRLNTRRPWCWMGKRSSCRSEPGGVIPGSALPAPRKAYDIKKDIEQLECVQPAAWTRAAERVAGGAVRYRMTSTAQTEQALKRMHGEPQPANPPGRAARAAPSGPWPDDGRRNTLAGSLMIDARD
jgi:hypothetical protein